jgi:hypothetical protein
MTELRKHLAASHARRRLQLGGLIAGIAENLYAFGCINGDILKIEEGTRLVSLVSLLEKLAGELGANRHDKAATLRALIAEIKNERPEATP